MTVVLKGMPTMVSRMTAAPMVWLTK